MRTPQPTGQVDAGLDRDHVPGAQRLLRRGPRQARSLVDLQADAVTEAVAEVLAVAGVLDHRTRDARRPRGRSAQPCTASSPRSCAESTSS